MAKEDKKDFNAMLADSRDMPKIQIVTDERTIQKYGGNRMYFAPPAAYDEVMKKVPFGKVNTLRVQTMPISQSQLQPVYLYQL